jgi:hypothetical protein
MTMLERLLGQSEAGAGRGKVNPKTIAEMAAEKRTPAQNEAIQEAKDRAAAKLQEAAYNNAMPNPYKKGGNVKSEKYMSFSKTGKPAGMKSVKKMSAGGFTKAADGIAQRGKTRGKMC